MAEKIKLDENLTIGQVLNLTNRGQKGTLKNNIQKAGLSLDDKFSKMRDTEFLKKLNEVGTEGNFTELTSVEKSLRELFNIEDTSGKFPFGDKTTFGSKGKARSPALNLEKADQARKAIEVELPSVKELNQSIHTATQKLVALGDAATKNEKLKEATKFYEAAALLQVKHHTGLRTMDIVNLATGKPERGSKYGTVVKGSDRLLQISNKGDRTNFRLSSMPMGILQDLAERNAPDNPNKSVKLFKTGKATLEGTINEVVNEVFSQNNIFIRDQNTGEPKKFTVGLLRKNLFDAIDEDYGAGVANRLLGHSTKGDVGLTHYKVTRTSRAKLDVNTLAAEQFNSTYLADIGQSSPKALMSSYKFSENFFPVEPIVKLTSTNPVEEAIQKTGLNLETKSVQVGANVQNVLKDTDKQIGRLEGQLDKLQGLQTQVEDLKKGSKTKKSLLETPSSPDDISQSIKDKLGKFGISLGKIADKGTKVLAGAIGVEAVRQLTTDPVAFAKDVVVETALEKGLGTGPGAFVGFALSPKEMGKATLDDSPSGEYTTIPLEQNIMKPDDIQKGFINQNQTGR
tara:strand:- start:33 stop:1742 length:1710 start_codon:yes stop_codon:yes gene_type:complete